jgi:Ca-activated chloride channel family protein
VEDNFQHRELLHLLWLVVVLGLIYAYGFARKRRALRRFATVNLFDHLLPSVSPGRQRFKAMLVLIAAAAIAIAGAGPRWGERYQQLPRKGIDLMIVLDVSRSMLAEDIAPSRLGRAKVELKDLVAQLPGDRVGLVTFAGTPVLTCPLTINYGALRMILDEVDVRSAPRGGTLIGDAVRLAAASFVDRIKEHKAILLITDGEDHESYPVDAARSAWEDHGIRTFTVGFGGAGRGARIPVEGEGGRKYMLHDGQEVWSKQDPRTLQEMAVVGGGAYFGVGTADADFGEIYERINAKVRERELKVAQKQVLIHRFQWFAGIALAFLLIETIMTDRRHRATAAAEQMRRAA